MTPDEREALVERMALAMCHSDCDLVGWTPKPTAKQFSGVEGYAGYVRRARAALAVAEPMVREDCAKWHDEQAAGEYALSEAADLKGDHADKKRHHAAGWEHEQSARHFRARGAA
jgi:hypothetical protein